MSDNFLAKITPPASITGFTLWFIFNDETLLLQKNVESYTIPLLTDFSLLNLPVISEHYLGVLNGLHCFCAEVQATSLPDTAFHFYPLKKAYAYLGETAFNIAGRALQILRWDRIHQFCGHCSTPLRMKAQERAKYCPHCQLHCYPKLSPSIIVAITRGDAILLARSPHFAPGVFSTLAGFVEPGETAEETVAREVMEEVGIKIKNIRYFGSQPWPFPDSFMLAFTAEYASGEITVDGIEIEAAQWFRIDNLPSLPSRISIARSLIDNFIEKQRGNLQSR